jgi:hypothetical protein
MNKLGCGGAVIIGVIILIIVANINSCGNKETDSDNKEQQEAVEQQEQEALKDPVALTSGGEYKTDDYYLNIANENETMVAVFRNTGKETLTIEEDEFSFEGIEGTIIEKVSSTLPFTVEPGNEAYIDFMLDYDYEKASDESFELMVLFTPTGETDAVAKWTLTITLDPEKRKKEADAEKEGTESIPAESTTISISAPELASEYVNNELKADKKYKGEWMYVTGTVYNIDKVFLAGVTVTLNGADGTDVMCLGFSDADEELIADLDTGDEITVCGECDGMGVFMVNLNGCVLLE